MYFYSLLFISYGFLRKTDGVKVNMQGSLTLGKEVVNSLAHYLRSNYNIDGRRRASPQTDSHTSETIQLLVNSAFLCRDLGLYQEDLSALVNRYIIMLTNSVENTFQKLLKANKQESDNNLPKVVIFEEELKQLLRIITRLLQNADKQIRDEEKALVFIWTDLFKRINAKFQERATSFASERLQGHPKEIDEVKQRLVQNIVVETSKVELEYLQKLCTQENICIRNYEVTKSLKTLLKQLQDLPDEKTKIFIRYFHETLPDTSFYYKISEVTSNAFQAILNDMAYTENFYTKNVLMAVQKTVDDRLVAIDEKKGSSSGRDVKLVHAILSDMDHFYSQHGPEPFHRFMTKFYEWIGTDARFSSPIRQVMKDIANTLSLESDELVTKLTNQVRVFLELTVDPEN